MPRFVPTLVLAAALAAPAAASAQSEVQNLDMRAAIDGPARLSLSALTLSFPDADPDTVPIIAASGGPLAISAKARTRPGEAVTLTVLTDDDLRSGTDVIPASAVSWTASGPGFVDGTLAAGVAQALASWTNSGVRSGTQTFRFANSWLYAPGTYSMTLTYTLTAP